MHIEKQDINTDYKIIIIIIIIIISSSSSSSSSNTNNNNYSLVSFELFYSILFYLATFFF